MFKQMDKKIFTISCSEFLFIWLVNEYVDDRFYPQPTYYLSYDVFDIWCMYLIILWKVSVHDWFLVFFNQLGRYYVSSCASDYLAFILINHYTCNFIIPWWRRKGYVLAFSILLSFNPSLILSHNFEMNIWNFMKLI